MIYKKTREFDVKCISSTGELYAIDIQVCNLYFSLIIEIHGNAFERVDSLSSLFNQTSNSDIKIL